MQSEFESLFQESIKDIDMTQEVLSMLRLLI